MSDIQYQIVQQLEDNSRVLYQRLFPKTMKDVIRWAEFLFSMHGIYARGLESVVTYFLEQYSITSENSETPLSDEDYLNIKDYLINQCRILAHLKSVAVQAFNVGNSLTTVIIPKTKKCICPKCGGVVPFNSLLDFNLEQGGQVKLSKSGEGFIAKCPACRAREVTFSVSEEVQAPPIVPLVIHWPLQYIEILAGMPGTDDNEYILRLDKWSELQNDIRNGNFVKYKQLPMKFLKFAYQGVPTKLKSSTFHFKFSSGLRYLERGWAYPRFLNSFNTVLQLILLDIYAINVLNDFKVPLKLITPGNPTPPGKGNFEIGTFPTATVTIDFLEQMSSIIEAHKTDPSRIFIANSPVNYQLLGSDIPDTYMKLMEYLEQRLLREVGAMPDMIRGTEAFVFWVLKRLRAEFSEFVREMNTWLSWYMGYVNKLTDTSPVKIEISQQILLDDPTQLFELAQSGIISWSTALNTFGINFSEERRKIMKEQLDQMEEQEDLAEKMRDRGVNEMAVKPPQPGEQVMAEQSMGGMGVPGMTGGGSVPTVEGAESAPAAPMQPGIGSPSNMTTLMYQINQGLLPEPDQLPKLTNVNDIEALGSALAQNLFMQPEGIRQSYMQRLKANNQTLWASTKAAMTDLYNQAKNMGVRAARNQM